MPETSPSLGTLKNIKSAIFSWRIWEMASSSLYWARAERKSSKLASPIKLAEVVPRGRAIEPPRALV